MTPKEFFTVLPQYILPHHLLSGWMSALTHSRLRCWKNLFIRCIIRLYGVNMQEARYQNLDHYPSFNDFFTRELKPGIRPLAEAAEAIVSPADGVVSQAGAINSGRIFQAKGHDYSVLELLGGNAEMAGLFENGSFATIYLSPKDYHRLHMPLSGILTDMIHVPGRLFSVNNTTVAAVPGLFARNERVVCLFDTAAGPMALILVGAIFVSSIETVWHGVVTPPTLTEIRGWQYPDQQVVLNRGEEMGRFNMGSTIVVLFAGNSAAWNAELQAGMPLKLGQGIGRNTEANAQN